MKVSNKMNYKKVALLLCMVIGLLGAGSASAQCPTGVAPVFSKTCFTEYFTSITASGPGVLSTSSVVGVTFGRFALK